MDPNTTSPETSGNTDSSNNIPDGDYQPRVIQPETPVTVPLKPYVTPLEPGYTPPAESSSNQVIAKEATQGVAVDPNQHQTPTAMNNTPVTQTQAPPPIFNHSANNPPGNNVTPYQSKRKLILFGAMAVVLVSAGCAAAVFGLYLPNRPQNVWSTGLNRSGTAVQKLVTAATTKDKLNTINKTELTATLDSTVKKSTYSGVFNVKFDTTKADAGLELTFKETGSPDKMLKAKVLSELPAGNKFPNSYIKITGIKSFGLENLFASYGEYDDKWIEINADYLESLGIPSATIKQSKDSALTAEDIAELAQVTSKVTTDYVLTANPQKAVFEQRKFIAKEKVDNLQAYHYQVGFNKSHAKDFCKAMTEKLFATNAYKKLSGAGSQDATLNNEQYSKDCQTSVDNDIKDSDTFDMWIDAKYKLIYKVRIVDDNNKQAYTDIGQRYSGGDNITLFANYHDDKGKTDASFTMETNLKTYVTKGVADVKSTEAENPYTIKVTAEAKPYKGEITVQKPAGSIPIQQILQKLGFDPTHQFDSSSDYPSSSTHSKAVDVERQTDIKALHGQIEAYYAQNGKYPTLADLNNTSWRATNMKGLDSQALKDPQGSSPTLVVAPAARVYAYAATDAKGKPCNNTTADCALYTLSATLEDGSTYTKNSLN